MIYQINKINYLIAYDKDLPKSVHPCDVCDAEKICKVGYNECDKKKIHFKKKI